MGVVRHTVDCDGSVLLVVSRTKHKYEQHQAKRAAYIGAKHQEMCVCWCCTCCDCFILYYILHSGLSSKGL